MRREERAKKQWGSKALAVFGCAGMLAMAAQADVSWRDEFGSAFRANWTVHEFFGTVSQTNGQMILETDVAGGSAQAAVDTLSDETDTLTQLNGAPLYNFYDHRVSARFDIASIAGTPNGSNGRNVFYCSIGDDSAGNFAAPYMDDGLVFSLERLNTGSGAFWWLVVYADVGGMQTVEMLANLSGLPSAVTYALDGIGMEVQLEGATFTDVSSGTVGGGGATLAAELPDLSANLSDYNFSFGAYNLGTVAERTVVALDSLSMDVASTPAYGPVAVENGGFTVRATGAQFFPVGFNYVDLRTETAGYVSHDTFNPNHYDAATVSSNMAEIAAAGFNTLRVFIDDQVSTNGVVVAPQDTELSTAYLQCVADFLGLAHDHGLYVVITFNSIPSSMGYMPYVDVVENVVGLNILYLNNGYITAKRVYMRDFIQMLFQLAPERLADTVLAFDPQNEITHYVDNPPFVLSSGTVTPANGVTYDLATDKIQLADEMAVYWVDQMAEEIHLQAPGVLVDANMFTYHAVGRTIGNFNMFGATNTYFWKDRYPFRPEALAASDADLLDLHFYTGNTTDLQNDLDSIEFAAVSNAWTAAGKPMIVGEFGAFKFALPTLSGAAAWKRAETDVFASLGFQGWLYWTYNTDLQPELWNAKSGAGEIFDALVAGAKANYFGYPPTAQDLDGDGMPDSWEIQYFGSTNAVKGGASEDFDSDDMANRNEYLAGTIPNDPASKFSMVGAQPDAGGLQIQWSTVPGNSYQVLRSASLVGPQWSTVGVPVVGTGAVSALTVPADAKEAFYKVRKDR